MKPSVSNVKLSDTLTLSECHDGFWLYDKTRGMNLSMRAKTSTDAFVEALTYYQHRLAKVEYEHKKLATLVEGFVGKVAEEFEDLMP